MKNAKKKNSVTPSLFLAVKSLLDAGATYSEVRKFYGLATDTIARIKQSETYDEYKQILAAVNAKIRERKQANLLVKLACALVPGKDEEEVQAITRPVVDTQPVATKQVIVPYSFQQALMERLDKQNELLTTISEKLAFLVEQWS